MSVSSYWRSPPSLHLDVQLVAERRQLEFSLTPRHHRQGFEVDTERHVVGAVVGFEQLFRQSQRAERDVRGIHGLHEDALFGEIQIGFAAEFPDGVHDGAEEMPILKDAVHGKFGKNKG